MKADKTKKDTRPAVNLTLSNDTIKKAIRLKKVLHRPSISNVVEHLIMEADETKKPEVKTGAA